MWFNLYCYLENSNKSLDLTVKNMHSDSVNTSGQHCCNYSNLDPWVFFSCQLSDETHCVSSRFCFGPVLVPQTEQVHQQQRGRQQGGDGARYYHIMTVPALKTRAAVSPGIDAQPRQKQRAVNGKPTTARHFFIWFFFCLFVFYKMAFILSSSCTNFVK